MEKINVINVKFEFINFVKDLEVGDNIILYDRISNISPNIRYKIIDILPCENPSCRDSYKCNSKIFLIKNTKTKKDLKSKCLKWDYKSFRVKVEKYNKSLISTFTLDEDLFSI